MFLGVVLAVAIVTSFFFLLCHVFQISFMFNAKKHHKKKKMVRILIWEGELWGIIMFVVFRQYQAGVFFCVFGI